MKKLLVLILFGTVVLFGFTGCGNTSSGSGDGNGTGTEAGDNTGTQDGTGTETGADDLIEENTSALELDAPVSAGDVVLSNGKYIRGTLSNLSEMSAEQKASVVAVIFDVENKKGIGLKEAKGLAWAIEDSLCGTTDFSQTPYISYRDVAKNQSDGKANMQEIKALPDYDQEHYPAFWWADHYGVEVNGSAEGWYIPSKEEIETITNKALSVYVSMELCKGALLNQKYYWSSTHCAGDGEAWAFLPDTTRHNPSHPGDFRALDYIEDEDIIEKACVRAVRVFK